MVARNSYRRGEKLLVFCLDIKQFKLSANVSSLQAWNSPFFKMLVVFTFDVLRAPAKCTNLPSFCWDTLWMLSRGITRESPSSRDLAVLKARPCNQEKQNQVVEKQRYCSILWKRLADKQFADPWDFYIQTQGKLSACNPSLSFSTSDSLVQYFLPMQQDN